MRHTSTTTLFGNFQFRRAIQSPLAAYCFAQQDLSTFKKLTNLKNSRSSGTCISEGLCCRLWRRITRCPRQQNTAPELGVPRERRSKALKGGILYFELQDVSTFKKLTHLKHPHLLANGTIISLKLANAAPKFSMILCASSMGSGRLLRSVRGFIPAKKICC